jgi:RHO1 GDP-GTP exchange protein 1/2
VSDRGAKDAAAKPKRILDVTNVTQVDVLEEFQLFLVLSAKLSLSYPLAALAPTSRLFTNFLRRFYLNCKFFKTSITDGQHLVCCVISIALSTTIKIFEPNNFISNAKKQKGFEIFNSSQVKLKAIKEFYTPAEPSSIHFLRVKLCVACAKGFEVISLKALEAQALLDQADTSLDFVTKKGGVQPIHIEQFNGEFLLNYSEFYFVVSLDLGIRTKLY